MGYNFQVFAVGFLVGVEGVAQLAVEVVLELNAGAAARGFLPPTAAGEDAYERVAHGVSQLCHCKIIAYSERPGKELSFHVLSLNAVASLNTV
jgi:hypothetical protein